MCTIHGPHNKRALSQVTSQSRKTVGNVLGDVVAPVASFVIVAPSINVMTYLLTGYSRDTVVIM